jgi:hypothetical protein
MNMVETHVQLRSRRVDEAVRAVCMGSDRDMAKLKSHTATDATVVSRRAARGLPLHSDCRRPSSVPRP